MSQSYASGDFTSAVSSPNAETFSGKIPAGKETVRPASHSPRFLPSPSPFPQNIMTAQSCSKDSCAGFYRGTANLGWGGSKMLVIKFEMPASGADTPPALWALNGKVVRTAQYGCNCRGMGAFGGCGELDIVEVLPEKPTGQGYSEIYSFRGTTGSGDGAYFVRYVIATSPLLGHV